MFLSKIHSQFGTKAKISPAYARRVSRHKPTLDTFQFQQCSYSPTNMGLLDPSTSDGRVIFFLPWENLTIAGTTDGPTSLSHFPAPSEEDIRFILNEIENYLSPEVRGKF